MSLIKWEPFDEFDRFVRDLHPLTANRGLQMGYDMAVDVYEDGNNVIAEMNVPGLTAADIDVEVEDNYLRVSGKREEVQEKKEKSHYAKEIRRGSFERVLQLPDLVEQDKVEAEYHNGVLKITMPKRAQVPEKKVKVQVR